MSFKFITEYIHKDARPVLHVSATRHHDGLPRHIREQRTRHSEDTIRSLRRRTRPPQRNIRKRRIAQRLALLLRDAQANLLPIGPGDERALLLGGRQPGEDVPKGDGVGADAKLGTPLLGDGLGEARDAGLGERVVELSRVAVDARRRGDGDDAARGAVADTEVGGRGADEGEGRGAVQRDDGVPLLVRHLVDHAVPRVAGVVDDDVDLAVAELGGLFHERGDVFGVGDVAGDGDCLAAVLVDAVGDVVGLLCGFV